MCVGWTFEKSLFCRFQSVVVTLSKTRRRKKISFIDKIADQAVSTAVSFVFTIALIGGGGYILFQFPLEKDAIDRQQLDLHNRVTSVQQFNEMLNVFASGWFADQTNWQPEGLLLPELARKRTTQVLDADLKQEILNWVNSNLPQVASEKGHIEAFVFKNDYERAFQQQLLKMYEIRIDLLGEINEMALNWEQEPVKSRDVRLANMQALRLESIGKFQGFFSKLDQLKVENRIDLQQAKQAEQEITSQLSILYVKHLLAITGIAVGVWLTVLVGKAIIMKNNKRHQR